VGEAEAIRNPYAAVVWVSASIVAAFGGPRPVRGCLYGGLLEAARCLVSGSWYVCWQSQVTYAVQFVVDARGY
jgi:hypothetical protein